MTIAKKKIIWKVSKKKIETEHSARRNKLKQEVHQEKNWNQRLSDKKKIIQRHSEEKIETRGSPTKIIETRGSPIKKIAPVKIFTMSPRRLMVDPLTDNLLDMCSLYSSPLRKYVLSMVDAFLMK